MKKDERIGIRVPAELKQLLTQIAAKEGRTLAQVCEVLLRAGVSEYGKRGSKFLQQFVADSQEEEK